MAREFAAYCHRRMIDNLLATSPLLKAVEGDDRIHLVERCRLSVFESGEKLIVQDELAAGIHLIASGQVTVVHRDGGEALEISRLGPGDSVGEVAVILRRRPNADVIAAYPTITLFMDAGTVRRIITEHPRLLAQLYALAVARDEETRGVAAADAKPAEDVLFL